MNNVLSNDLINNEILLYFPIVNSESLNLLVSNKKVKVLVLSYCNITSEYIIRIPIWILNFYKLNNILDSHITTSNGYINYLSNIDISIDLSKNKFKILSKKKINPNNWVSNTVEKNTLIGFNITIDVKNKPFIGQVLYYLKKKFYIIILFKNNKKYKINLDKYNYNITTIKNINIGSRVYFKKENKWYLATIVNFDILKNSYTISLDNGDIDYITLQNIKDNFITSNNTEYDIRSFDNIPRPKLKRITYKNTK